MNRASIITGICVFLIFAAAIPLLSDGVLIVDRTDFQPGEPSKQPLTVKYHRVSVEITDQVATTRIDQVFKNSHDADLEGTYIFPLPESSAITEFSLWINGKRTGGEVMDREKARRIYEEIVRQMIDPGLLEYVGRNMFRARVYPIPAKGETRIELEYTETLRYDAGLVRYVYPLDTERFSPDPIEEVTISAEISSSVPLKSVYSPSHEIDTKVETYGAVAGYEDSYVKPDTDFVLYYTVSEKDVGANLLAYREEGEKGYFLLLLSPGQIEGPRLKKDIVFVLDTSGSMRGPKIGQAKRALSYCIERLGDGDRFSVIGFATGVDPMESGLVPANEKTRETALAFVDDLSARGGTNIGEALLEATGSVTGSDPEGPLSRPRIIVFLTDGEPTVGETDAKRILSKLEDANRAGARIFVFGVGTDVNTHLLDRISIEHRGISEYVGPDEKIERVISSFYTKISEPVLSDIELDWGRVETSGIFPVVLPDLFKGTQLVLLGRYEGRGTTAISLEGNVEGKRKKFVYEVSFPGVQTKNDFIPRLWAMRKIGYLMNEIRLNGENRELIDEIVSLSKEHGIMTPYTSFLVLENEAEYDRFGISEPKAEMIRDSGRKYKEAMDEEVGARSVARATDILALKQATIQQAPASKTVTYAGKKVFYLKDGRWIDSEYTSDMKTVRVKLFSKKYFDLIKKVPELGKYLALGRSVTVVFKGKCYSIDE